MTDTQREFERLINAWNDLPDEIRMDRRLNDLADVIMKYPAPNKQAALAHSQQWISVSDRLPEKGADILVWCGWVISAMYDGKSTFYTEDGTNPIYQVTHWMPLPQPPITNRKDE